MELKHDVAFHDLMIKRPSPFLLVSVGCCQTHFHRIWQLNEKHQRSQGHDWHDCDWHDIPRSGHPCPAHGAFASCFFDALFLFSHRSIATRFLFLASGHLSTLKRATTSQTSCIACVGMVPSSGLEAFSRRFCALPELPFPFWVLPLAEISAPNSPQFLSL